jgi:hypothetical protein
MGHVALARTAKTHAVRAVALSWAVLGAVLAATLALPHGWFDFFLPVEGFTVIPVAMVVAAAIVLLIPLERVGDKRRNGRIPVGEEVPGCTSNRGLAGLPRRGDGRPHQLVRPAARPSWMIR